MFKQGMEQCWDWAKQTEYIRVFTDGEYRYSKYLWPLAHAFLKSDAASGSYRYRKVWRYGLEVACKVKASPGTPRQVWRYRVHPYTAISLQQDIHANHQEAFNASLRRRCSAYRRQNLYAKRQDALQHTLTVQRLFHNWVRVHISLSDKSTPAMMGYIDPSRFSSGNAHL